MYIIYYILYVYVYICICIGIIFVWMCKHEFSMVGPNLKKKVSLIKHNNCKKNINYQPHTQPQSLNICVSMNCCMVALNKQNKILSL